jgi:hypothetical protein
MQIKNVAYACLLRLLDVTREISVFDFPSDAFFTILLHKYELLIIDHQETALEACEFLNLRLTKVFFLQ